MGGVLPYSYAFLSPKNKKKQQSVECIVSFDFLSKGTCSAKLGARPPYIYAFLSQNKKTAICRVYRFFRFLIKRNLLCLIGGGQPPYSYAFLSQNKKQQSVECIVSFDFLSKGTCSAK